MSNIASIQDKYFVSGVIKVQCGKESTLCVLEKEALKHLLLPEEGRNAEPAAPSAQYSFSELLKEKRTEIADGPVLKSKYDPVIMTVKGDASPVEQLWSQADAVLTKRRSSMSPAVFECIMYLKYNADLWGLADVVEANRRRMGKSKANQDRLAELKQRLEDCEREISSWDELFDKLEELAI